MKHKLWKIIEILCEILFFVFPIKNNRVMFRSFAGQYNDNPRRISEKLHELDNTIEIIWIVSDKCHEKNSIPVYVKQIKDNTIYARFYKKTSRVLVENGIGWDMWLKYSYLYPIYKRKGQFNISTWHGGLSIKHIGYDIDNYNKNIKKNGATISDVVTLSNEFSRKTFQNAFFGDRLNFVTFGTPKNDILFNSDSNLRNVLLHKMKLDSKYKYILYAPTYRDDVEYSGIRQLNEFNIIDLLNTLSMKFGGEFKLIIRPHNLVLNMLRKLNYIDNQYVFDGSLCDDMNEYLYISDVLVTDYSSCIGDNLLTTKPCFLYVSDFDKYNKDRGQGGEGYMSIYDFPYPISKSFSELKNSIINYNIKVVETERIELLNRIGNYERGYASQKSAELILSKIYSNYS